MKSLHPQAWIGLLLCGVAAAAQAQRPGPLDAITDVPGISVGHATGADSGATVVFAASATGQGVGGGVVQRGGSPGTRETDLLRPDNLVETINAIVLAGGSAYGLAAASGVMRCLEERGVGFPVGGGNVVPIVPAAVTFDRATCNVPPASRPTFTSGRQACASASNGAVAQGNVGAGTGAVAGGVKGGIGSASVVLPGGVIVGALVAINSEGTPYNEAGRLYALDPRTAQDAGTPARSAAAVPPSLPGGPLRSGTLAVVATNVQLTKSQATRIAEMADDGVARSVRPAHTPGDSDTLFVLGTARVALNTLGEESAALAQLGGAAADVVARAIVNALFAARATACQPSYCDAFPAACAARP